MPSALSINIGLNSVDPSHYQGWDGKLVACEFDAQDMRKVAEAQGIDGRLILTAEATADAVTAAIADAAEQLHDGDLLVVSNSSHGGQLTDSDEDEQEGLDETWVLYDRQLIDDELYALWARFEPGVRIVVLSDSCHSGSVTRMLPRYEEMTRSSELRTKGLPLDIQAQTFRAHRAEYEAIQEAHPEGDDVPVGAHVLLISGCKDDQLSLDGMSNGLFTRTLLKVWNEGAFEGDYVAFHQAIVERMPDEQTPQLSMVGTPSEEFEHERPLTP
jgi:hypothetical protein